MLKLIGGTLASKDRSGYIPGRKTLKRIVKHLDKLSNDPKVLMELDDFFQTSRNFNFSRRRVPEVPDRSQPSHLIDKYVKDLTTTRYGGRLNSERDPEEVTRALEILIGEDRLTDAGKNSAIEFYARSGDPDKILHLVCALELPQRTHFNQWLYSLYSQRRWKPQNYQFKSTLPILAAMNDCKLSANGQTWNMVLMAMPTHSTIGTIYQEMHNRSIPLDKEATNILTSSFCSVHGVDAVAESLEQEATVISRPMLHAVLKRMLTNMKKDNANILQAFDYLNYWAARGIKPTQTTLNIFLEQFSYRHHLDWMVGISEFFESEFGVAMTTQSWAHMLYAVARINESPQKYRMIGMVIKESNKLALTDGAKAAIRFSSLCAEKNSQIITYPGDHVWPYLRNSLSWQKYSGPPDYKKDVEAAKAAGAMGFTNESAGVTLKNIDLRDVGIYIGKLD